ncbi:MAG TPA: hypothetical protein DIT01_08180 [Lentisphaeria bacterium]|nr:hypothetical protein [Lentisphaeria bacterium]
MRPPCYDRCVSEGGGEGCSRERSRPDIFRTLTTAPADRLFGGSPNQVLQQTEPLRGSAGELFVMCKKEEIE